MKTRLTLEYYVKWNVHKINVPEIALYFEMLNFALYLKQKTKHTDLLQPSASKIYKNAKKLVRISENPLELVTKTLIFKLKGFLSNDAWHDMLYEYERYFANINVTNLKTPYSAAYIHYSQMVERISSTNYLFSVDQQKYDIGDVAQHYGTDIICFFDNFNILLESLKRDYILNFHRDLFKNPVIFNTFAANSYSSTASLAINLLKMKVQENINSQNKYKSESQMMMTVFNENNPLIKINNLSTPTEISEQEGFKFLITGLFKKYRNKYAHNQLEEIDKQECINVLFMVTECLDILDNISKKENTASESEAV